MIILSKVKRFGAFSSVLLLSGQYLTYFVISPLDLCVHRYSKPLTARI